MITFDTTHHALWAEEIAGEHGIPAQPVPAPAEANAQCSIALEVLPGDEERLVALLEEAGVRCARYPR
jgi:hypothetical protein